MSFQLNIYGDVVFGYLAFYIYIYQISVVVGLGEDCGHIHTTFSSETSLVPTSDSHEWIRDLYHKGLSCQDSPDCKAVAKTTVGSVEAVCSATPGSLPSVGVYIVRRESDIPGNFTPLCVELFRKPRTILFLSFFGTVIAQAIEIPPREI